MILSNILTYICVEIKKAPDLPAPVAIFTCLVHIVSYTSRRHQDGSRHLVHVISCEDLGRGLAERSKYRKKTCEHIEDEYQEEASEENPDVHLV